MSFHIRRAVRTSKYARGVNLIIRRDRILTHEYSTLQSLGPADYLTLAATYNTVVISHIPALTLSTKDQARRFISLIDALYEARCKLMCLAEAQPDFLFFAGRSTFDIDNTDVMMAESVGETREVYRPNVSSYDTLDLTGSKTLASPTTTVPLNELSLFSGKLGSIGYAWHIRFTMYLITDYDLTGKDEQFAFKRALSRLKEMTSGSYWEEVRWSPLPLSVRKWEGYSKTPAALLGGSSEIVDGEPSPPVTTMYGADDALSHVRPEAPHVRENHIWGMRRD